MRLNYDLFVTACERWSCKGQIKFIGFIAQQTKYTLINSNMKNYKVYLNIYDFMGCNSCLECMGVGAFHTGVEIGTTQYCYTVCSDDPDDSGVMTIEPQSAQYNFNRKVFLGEIKLMNYRLNQIVSQLSEQFTVGKYHMFNNNCNHFSNELSKRLTDNQIPKFIFRSSNILGYLCCCLPECITNGQYAYRKMMENYNKEEREEELIDKWEPVPK